MKIATVKQYNTYKAGYLSEQKEEIVVYEEGDGITDDIEIKGNLLRVVQSNYNGDTRVLWFTDFNLEEKI